MPYSWNRPPVPIDKSKQGGRSFDSSTYTDFRKVGTISQVNATKTGGQNNKNLYTDTEEIRRANILISGLQTIPRALCVCPGQGTVTANSILSSNATSALSGISFFVMFYNDNFFGAYLSNNIIYTNSGLSTILTNSNVTGVGDYTSYRVGNATSLPNIPAGSSRQDVVNSLNSLLATIIFNTDNTLVASVTGDGKLVLSITGTTPFPTGGSPPYFAGLFFGDGPSGSGNGSTTLGTTNQDGRCGVDGAALVITQGNTSVTSPFVIADPVIDFSTPPGGC